MWREIQHSLTNSLTHSLVFSIIICAPSFVSAMSSPIMLSHVISAQPWSRERLVALLYVCICREIRGIFTEKMMHFKIIIVNDEKRKEQEIASEYYRE